jgi:hypothetical protein
LIYLKTNLNAPWYKVVTIDISTETRDFIPELEDATLSEVKCVNVIYKRNVVAPLAIYF